MVAFIRLDVTQGLDRAHIVLFIDGPHLKSVTLVTLQAVKLESDHVVFLFLALESSLEDLVVLAVMKDPARSVEWNGIRVASEFSSSHPILVIVHALGSFLWLSPGNHNIPEKKS